MKHTSSPERKIHSFPITRGASLKMGIKKDGKPRGPPPELNTNIYVLLYLDGASRIAQIIIMTRTTYC
jgi:hypothetical protein